MAVEAPSYNYIRKLAQVSQPRELDPATIDTVLPTIARTVRKAARLSQREVADAVGYVPPLISLLESGRRGWRLGDNLQRWNTVLRVYGLELVVTLRPRRDKDEADS